MYRFVFMMLGILAVCNACTSPPDAYHVAEQEPASPAQAGFEDGQVAYGRGDYATAYKVWLPLARQGHASAQGTLGFLYYTGQGVRQDHAEAAKWYSKAAEQGNTEAQYNLGNSYRRGEGVPQDYNEAFKWIRMAAEQGYFQAYNNLGVMYEFGHGVLKDYIRAYASFSLAANWGNAKGSKNRDIVANKMTPAEIVEAEQLAREWMKMHGKAESSI